jgi:hypothetical protein
MPRILTSTTTPPPPPPDAVSKIINGDSESTATTYWQGDIGVTGIGQVHIFLGLYKDGSGYETATNYTVNGVAPTKTFTWSRLSGTGILLTNAWGMNSLSSISGGISAATFSADQDGSSAPTTFSIVSGTLP